MPFLLGGLFIGVLSALPIVQLCNCCCLWIIGGGVLAAYMEGQNQPTSLTMGQGAKVGLFAGIIGAIVWFMLDSALGPLQTRFMGEVMRSTGDLPPELQDWLETLEEGRERGSNVFGFVLMLIFSSIVATIGGMIGAAYFKKDVPPALGGPINPPPLP
jgi:hypothetical protein